MSSDTPKKWTDKVVATQEDYFKEKYGVAIGISKTISEIHGEDFAYKVLEKKSEEVGTGFGKQFMENREPFTCLKDFSESYKEYLRQPLFQMALNIKIVEDTATRFMLRVDKCLWAHTFKEQDTSEIGYHLICHGDFAVTEALSPHLRLKRTKTLMRGDPSCLFEWSWKED